MWWWMHDRPGSITIVSYLYNIKLRIKIVVIYNSMFYTIVDKYTISTYLMMFDK